MTGTLPEKVSREDLMRFLDGETTPEERAAIEVLLETSSELRREFAIFLSMKKGFQDLSLVPRGGEESVWDRIRSRITLPVGWVLMAAGAAAWIGYGIWVFLKSPVGVLVRLASGGVVIGVLVLLANVIWDRYKEYGTDPYRDVHR